MIFKCMHRFRFIVVFLMVFLIKYICISIFLTNSVGHTTVFSAPS